MNPHVQGFFDPSTFTVSYVVHDPATKKAAIIDPVLDFTPRNGRTSTQSADALLRYVDENDLTLDWLLETHAHADHLSAAHYLHEKTGAPIVIGSEITHVQGVFGALFEADDVKPDGSAFGQLVREGETLPLGNLLWNTCCTATHVSAEVNHFWCVV